VPRWLSLSNTSEKGAVHGKVYHQFQSRPLASTWPSTFFWFMAFMLQGALSWPSQSSVTSCSSSSLRRRLAWLGSRRAGRRTIGLRELVKLGHDARLMPPAHVKPYVRRQKNGAADVAAICEAVTRPSTRFVGVRSLEDQAMMMRHKTREMLVSQRTQLPSGLRGHLTEIGVIAAQGPRYTASWLTASRRVTRRYRWSCATRWRRSRYNCATSRGGCPL
jgi:hypothetical protein